MLVSPRILLRLLLFVACAAPCVAVSRSFRDLQGKLALEHEFESSSKSEVAVGSSRADVRCIYCRLLPAVLSDDWVNFECQVTAKTTVNKKLSSITLAEPHCNNQDQVDFLDTNFCGLWYKHSEGVLTTTRDWQEQSEHVHMKSNSKFPFVCDLIDNAQMIKYAIKKDPEIAHRFTPDTSDGTTPVLTPLGLVSAQLPLGAPDIPVLGAEVIVHYYMGVSGGGWRALSAAMGAFRGLSKMRKEDAGDLTALEQLKYVSSVSGGSWFMSSLMYSQVFSDLVLVSDEPVAIVVERWFKAYFQALRTNSIAAMASPPTSLYQSIQLWNRLPLPGMGSSGLINAAGVAFDWRELIEKCVLDSFTPDLSAKDPTARIANKLQTAILSFNWLTLKTFMGPTDISSRLYPDADAVVYPPEDPATQDPIPTSFNVPTQVDAEQPGSVLMRGAPASLHYGKRWKAEEFTCRKTSKVDVRVPDAMPALTTLKNAHDLTFQAGDIAFELTVGQIASLSSAAVGMMANIDWLSDAIKVIRAMHSSVTNCIIVRNLPIAEPVRDKLENILNCKRTSTVTPCKTMLPYSKAMEKLAVRFGGTNNELVGIDGGFSDNGGVGSILTAAAGGEANRVRVLVFLLNELGDDQLSMYYVGGHPDNGHLCSDMFSNKAKQDSMNDLGRTCAISTTAPTFFAGNPPVQHRANDDHVTYAYQAGVTVVDNDTFGVHAAAFTDKAVDVLWVMLNAPVSTGSFDVKGSEAFIGNAVTMHAAVTALRPQFELFFQ